MQFYAPAAQRNAKYLLEKIAQRKFNKVLANGFRQLRKAKRLEAFKVRSQYLVAVDGVEFNRANHEIPHSCNRKLANEQTTPALRISSAPGQTESPTGRSA